MLEPWRRRRAPSQRETVPTTWIAVAELFGRVAEAMETAARLAVRHADGLRQAGNNAAAATERQAAERARAARRARSLSRSA